MKITKMEIKNYRLLKNTSIDLEKELSLIIGKNNCGKTSILSILNKFIGDQSVSNNFAYDDFNTDFKDLLWKAVNERVIDWNTVALQGISMYIYIQCEDSDNLRNAEKLMLDLDPNNNTVVIKFEYFLSTEAFQTLIEEFDKYYNKHIGQEKKLCFKNFMASKHKKYFVIRKSSVLFDVSKNKVDETEYREIDSKLVDLHKIISFKYISAHRNTSNAENDNSLSGLSSKYYERTKSKNDNVPIIESFEDKLVETDTSLSDIYETIFEGVLKKIKQFGGIKKNETIVKIISTLSQQQLLKGNTTVVYEDHGQMLPETYNGLGYLNLISIIFEIETILSDFRSDIDDTARPSDINLLFIEEPEAHTHPQMQYVFIKNIKSILTEGSDGSDNKNAISLQSIITTHSSHIVSECDFDDVKYFQKISPTEVVSKNLKELMIKYQSEKEDEKNHYKFLKQYLTLNRAEIFFTEKVILFEGDTERILLPAMMKKIDQEDEDTQNTPLLSQNITLMEVGNYSQIFDAFLRFIGVKTLIITDLDAGKKIQAISREDGKPRTKKNGEPIYTITKADYSKATHTTNGALKHFYKNPLAQTEKTEFQFFKERTLEEKVLKNTSEGWETDALGQLMLVYQIEETNSDGEKYIARSFEDSFFHINRNFVGDQGSVFESLKCKEKIKQKNQDGQTYQYSAYEVAKECIQSKPSFAMDILLNSTYQDGSEYSNWQIPQYIKEGLLWLKKRN